MGIKRALQVRGCAGLLAGLTCAAVGLWALPAAADAAPVQRPVTVSSGDPDVPHNMPGAVRGDGSDIVVSPGKIPNGCWVEIYQTGDVGPKGSYRQTVTVEVCNPPEQPDSEQHAPDDGESKSVSGALTVGGA